MITFTVSSLTRLNSVPPCYYPCIIPGMSFGDSVWEERVLTGGGGWVHPQGEKPWPCLGSAGNGTGIPILFSINGFRNKPPLPVFKGCFLVIPGWHFPRNLIEISLIGGHGYSHISAQDGWNYHLDYYFISLGIAIMSMTAIHLWEQFMFWCCSGSDLEK